MERNYISLKISDVFYIQYETHSNHNSKWYKTMFKDMNGNDLRFIRKIDAENWIKAREEIINS